MAMYTTGAVTIKIGSQTIIGNGTDFLTYVSKGNLFKRTAQATFYEVASVITATKLTLTGRFADSDYHTNRTAENTGTVTTATKMYSGTLNNTPIIQTGVVINASIESFTDDGAGVLTGGGSPAGSGTINYDTGGWTITLGTDITATEIVTASYNSGDTLNGMSYQIVRDYTPHKEFPEMGLNDLNFPHIYTKAIRMIDEAFYRPGIRSTSSDYTATNTDRTIVVTGNTSRVTITLPPATSSYKGRRMDILNNSASNVLATPYETPTLIKGVGASAVSTNLTGKYQVVKFILATTNLWIIDKSA